MVINAKNFFGSFRNMKFGMPSDPDDLLLFLLVIILSISVSVTKPRLVVLGLSCSLYPLIFNGCGICIGLLLEDGKRLSGMVARVARLFAANMTSGFVNCNKSSWMAWHTVLWKSLSPRSKVVRCTFSSAWPKVLAFCWIDCCVCWLLVTFESLMIAGNFPLALYCENRLRFLIRFWSGGMFF